MKAGKNECTGFKTINPTLRLFIQNGLESQTLNQFLEQGLQLVKVRQEFRAQIIQAGLYPTLVLIASILLFIFISVWVLPQMISFFKDANLVLPPTLSFYLILQKYIPWLFLSIGMIGIGLWFFKRELIKNLYQKAKQILLKFLARWETWVEFQILPWIMGFRALIAAGWSELPALQTSLVLAPQFESLVQVPVLIRDIQSGQSLAQAFQNQKQAPIFFRQQLFLAVQGQDLQATLKNLEEYYHSRNQKFLKMVSVLIEPVMMGAMGFLVGALIVLVFFPLLQSMQNVSF